MWSHKLGIFLSFLEAVSAYCITGHYQHSYFIVIHSNTTFFLRNTGMGGPALGEPQSLYPSIRQTANDLLFYVFDGVFCYASIMLQSVINVLLCVARSVLFCIVSLMKCLFTNGVLPTL